MHRLLYSGPLPGRADSVKAVSLQGTKRAPLTACRPASPASTYSRAGGAAAASNTGVLCDALPEVKHSDTGDALDDGGKSMFGCIALTRPSSAEGCPA